MTCSSIAGWWPASIGRLCLAIFGARTLGHKRAGAAHRLADDLGVAMQLTNILRDLREDAGNGRVYMPREDLRSLPGERLTGASRAGRASWTRSCASKRAVRANGSTGVSSSCRYWIAAAGRVCLRWRTSTVACSGASRTIPNGRGMVRVSLPIWEKGWVASRSIFKAALGRPPVRDRRWQHLERAPRDRARRRSRRDHGRARLCRGGCAGDACWRCGRAWRCRLLL